MLSQKLQDAINAQVNAEMWSAYLYLSMSLDAAAKGHKGVANWFAIQFKEEQDHAQIFINYVLSRGGEVKLAPIAEVRTSWESPLEAFKDTLAHEKKVTAMIDNLAHMAAEEKDFATSNMLVWFIDEQIEEEENASDIINSLEQVDDSKLGLYMIDKELAARTYTQPSLLAAGK
ncbi:MAG: ferritin [Alistipes sp.]|nr:ferritin [Alistipes sp.]